MTTVHIPTWYCVTLFLSSMYHFTSDVCSVFIYAISEFINTLRIYHATGFKEVYYLFWESPVVECMYVP